MDNTEAIQIMQRLKSLKIVETPRQQQRESGLRECQSEIVRKTQVPATPCMSASSFQSELKKRRKMKLNRVYNYESDMHFIKARKSLNF
ncbi:protein Z600 [Drosophila sulfurigaster albostrigata]|uniref:Protein Z600 n=1 Tax=Drosophila albomicans TaxID=7291 RepID=A0A6P8XGW5_DROAB|nr:protein Z600 [Drosophila albomicans]XP_060651360.1 protein Z600 [Drosophila nasuta]XP_062137400.1 protein Z600 [Drosophila sulfurigaster albostrigata]